MIAIVEKSKYYEENTDYFVIKEVNRHTSYKVKSILDPQSDVFSSIRFEHMPMIVPTSHIPDDDEYTGQWNMQQILAGGRITTPPNPPDNGTTVWDLTTGSENVVICVIDSGCDLTHPDLKFASPGINLDTMANDGSPVEGPQDSENIGHGTCVAGIIAATHNFVGVAGVAGNCKILPVAFVNWTDEELIRGINFARMSAVKVINMSISFNGYPRTSAMDKAIEEASENIFICASSGNQNRNTVDYPASNPFVMACGATNQGDNRKTPTPGSDWGSNFGPEMSVVAPGTAIPSTDILGPQGYNKNVNGDYNFSFNGTSAAVPHVSGLAALIFSVYPEINTKDVRDVIERTTDKVGTGISYQIDPAHPNGTWNNEMGYGRINTLRAVIAASAYNPNLPWFREVDVSGSMFLQDYEKIKENETKSVDFENGLTIRYPLGPFQPPVEIPVWIEKVGGEIRAEVRFSMYWKTDSSIDLKYNIKLYEGTSEETTELGGEKSGTVNIPKDMTINLNTKVTNTAESEDRDFVEVKMKFKNDKRS